MPNTPVLKINVDDSQFKAFYDLFAKYHAEVGELPEGWAEAAKSMRLGISTTGDEARALNVQIEKSLKTQRDFALATHTSAKHFKSLAESAKTLAGNLRDVEKFVLRLGAVGFGVIGGGLFGLDRLAADTAKTGVQAHGLGMTPGQLRAFDLNYRYIAPANMLQSVFNAQHDLNEVPNAAYAVGMGVEAFQHANPEQVAAQALQAAHDYYQRYHNDPAMFNTSNPAMEGFASVGINTEGVAVAGMTPEATLQKAQAGALRDAPLLNTPQSVLNAMSAFNIQLALVGHKLEVDLGNHLATLAPELSHVIGTLGGVGSKLLDDVLSPANVRAVGKGLQAFERDLNNGFIKAEIQKFGAELGDLSSELGSITKFLRGLGIGNNEVAKAKPGSFDSTLAKGGPTGAEWLLHKLGDALGMGTPYAPDRVNLNAGALGAAVAAGDAKLGAPGFLQAEATVESSDVANAVNPATGAKGLYQDMPAIVRAYHFDPRNPIASTNANVKLALDNARVLTPYMPAAGTLQRMELLAAAHYEGATALRAQLGDLAKQRHESPQALGAQLRTDSGFVDAEQHLPGDVRTYVQKVLGAYIKDGRQALAQDRANATLKQIARSTSTIANNTRPRTPTPGGVGLADRTATHMHMAR